MDDENMEWEILFNGLKSYDVNIEEDACECPYCRADTAVGRQWVPIDCPLMPH